MLRRAGLKAVSRALRALLLPSLLLTSLGSCLDILLLPENAEYFEPPPAYRLWWEETLACSGASRSIDGVDFFVVPYVMAFPSAGSEVSGIYHWERDRIIIAGSYQFHGPVVRHEMLHAMLPKQPGHPREYFLHRCGKVVDCVGNCEAEAGPLFPLPSRTRALAAESLLVTSAVNPSVPIRSITGDWLTFVISVTNPKPYPVLVTFADAGLPGGPRPFGFQVRYPAGGSSTYNDFLTDDGLRFFRAGETKRAVFDFPLSGSGFPNELPLGINGFSGRFGGRAAPPVSVMVAP